jgi:hypothetical protein
MPKSIPAVKAALATENATIDFAMALFPLRRPNSSDGK